MSDAIEDGESERDDNDVVRSIEIANFEGPDCYMSLRVDDDNKLKLVSEHDHVEIILENFGRWYSEEHDWKELDDAESEDECERCGGDGRVDDLDPISANMGSKPCPNCSDESEELTKSVREDVSKEVEANQEKKPFGSYDRDELMKTKQKPEYRLDDEDEEYDEPEEALDDTGPLPYDDCPSTHRNNYDEPRPEDEEWREKFLHASISGIEWKENDLGLPQDQVGWNTGIGCLIDYIEDLEQELESVREERDKWKTIADDIGNIQAVLEILSSDSDGGDSE